MVLFGPIHGSWMRTRSAFWDAAVSSIESMAFVDLLQLLTNIRSFRGWACVIRRYWLWYWCLRPGCWVGSVDVERLL